MEKLNGKLIAAFGIPGSGKSTTTREIGKSLNFETFHEPEEEEWGEAVKLRQVSGNFTALMWFRSARVPLFYKADQLRKSGFNSMVDSCYDKLFHLYLNKEGIDWLYSKSDIYYNEVINIALKDYINLPNIDIIIFFKQTENIWNSFISHRNRDLDKDIEFKNSFALQKALLEAANIYCNESNCKLIIHEQSISNPKIEADKIVNILKYFL